MRPSPANLHERIWCSARHEREQSFQTLLEWQCKRAREDVCNIADRNGATLLHVLCTTTGPVQMMILLMAEGAEPTLLDINESPLVWLLRVLSPNVKSKDAFIMVRALSKNPKAVLIPNSKGNISLHYAARRADWGFFRHLVNMGSQQMLNQADQKGCTPLIVALEHGNGELVGRMLKFFNVELGCQQGKQLTGLHLTARYCTPETVRCYALHRAIWDVNDSSPGLREWLASINGGDVVRVYPKAHQAAWYNNVREMTITLYYERRREDH